MKNEIHNYDEAVRDWRVALRYLVEGNKLLRQLGGLPPPLIDEDKSRYPDIDLDHDNLIAL